MDFIHLKESIIDTVRKAGITVKLNEEDDVSCFIKEGIIRIPAVKIDDKTIVKQQDETIEEYIETLNDTILNKEKFGKMKKIIVPVDFSEASENALTYGLNLAKTLNAAVEVLHVYHPEISTDEYMPITMSAQEQSRRDKLDQLVESLSSEWNGILADELIQPKFVVGFAADELISASKDDNEPLIVMGSSGSSANVKKILGSVTTKVALQAKCPVYIIPPDAKYNSLDNVVYCSKTESMDSQLANKVINLIKADTPTVHLLHIGLDANYQMDLLLEVWNQFYPDGQIKDVLVPLETESKVINEYCQEADADLLVVARKERNFLQDLFHKSITKELVISATKPMLILHSETQSIV